jgi:hypothetical protein
MTNLIAPSFACSTLSCADHFQAKVYSVLRERHMRYCENCGQMPSECGWGAAMKRCAQCHGKLGLGVRFCNLWNGRWWVHVRFCSVRCESIYEVKRNDAAKQRWHAFLARGNLQS